ncbi:4-hydroxy-3-polyprenylbenzoate decarboxylase [Mobilisporobacter senegalensis]|uniref:Flavin prenyltransferase UbiX n=2 Tax=Mobilisporobacter senegalensis TaxID=1329262 RepID=A0A3N1XQ03_9FIRM|nr:4-hydroxy-3-polyprenylbenzoate decarboxylase [Mobilisporobacter senegalensis]
MNYNKKKRLVIGMSGASGAILGITLLELMKEHTDWETHLVISKGAQLTIRDETEYTLDQVKELADYVYDNNNVGDALASGTFRTEGMVVIPCSMKTAAGIANGFSDNLLLRTADVTIKEGRKLIVVPRETPLSTIHLRNMLLLAEAGAMVIPPMVTYYNQPADIEDMNRQIVGKILDKFDIEVIGFKRWKDKEDNR